jgi:hypothetical protein
LEGGFSSFYGNLPDWMKHAFDGRFNELIKIAGKLKEIEPLRQKQSGIESQLKQKLIYP